MGVYLVPGYLKPRSRIATWNVPMSYVEEEKQEYISDLKIAPPAIKGEIRYFTEYELLTMKTDIRGNPEAFKVLPNPEKSYRVPVENFVEQVTEGKEIATISGEFDLLRPSGEQLIKRVYNSLSSDLRVLIAPPLQWLVWYPDEKLLTRMCWVVKIGGKIVVRPYGTTSLLLEVSKIQLDKVNSADLRVVKKNALLKQNLNNAWRSMVAAEELETELEGFEGLESESEATEEGEGAAVGEVE